MRRSQFEHVIRAACAVLGVDEVLVLGSQTVLGRWNEFELPAGVTLSRELDIAAWGVDDDLQVRRMADELDGALGQDSEFDHAFGVYADGVEPATAVLPPGWEQRLEPYCNEGTAYKTGWCLNPEDACVAKLAAQRENDYAFVAALITHGLVDRETIARRAEQLHDPHHASRIPLWVRGFDQH